MRKKFNNENPIVSNEKLADNDLLIAISNSLIKSFDLSLVSCFDQIDDTLFKMAENASTNNNQNLYFSSINILRKNKAKAIKYFYNSLEMIFKSFNEKSFSYVESLTLNHDKIFSLELIDESELDESLTISNMVRKSNTAYQKQLYALQIRFSSIISSENITLEQLPISPFVIINSYANCLKSMNLANDIKLIVYKLFEQCVMANLTIAYTSINDFLVQQGIVVVINYSVQSQKESSKEDSDNNEGITVNNAIKEAFNNGKTQHSNNSSDENHLKASQSLDANYQSIIHLLSQSRGVPQHNRNRDVKKHYQVFTQHLSDIQSTLISHKVLTDELSYSPLEISLTILNHINRIDYQEKISQKDEDTIDLIGLLFQFIVESKNLPDEIQVILSKLQIPYLKIALKDGNLFANKDHEARALLNSLALASIGWNKETDYKGKFIEKIKEISQHILDIEHLSTKVFSILQMNFDNFLKGYIKKSRLTQERTKKSTLAQEKIIRAKEASAKLLVNKIDNNTINPYIKGLLLVDWFNVLNLMFLRFSAESAEIKEKSDFVDDIIACSQLTHAVKSEEIEDLLIRYETGLKMVAYNPKEMKDKKEQLANLLYQYCNEKTAVKTEKILSHNIYNIEEVRSRRTEIYNVLDDSDARISSSENTDFQIKDKHYSDVKNLKIGTWLNFKNLTKKSIRAKLSWISPLSQKYLFVNSRGVKVTHKSLQELAHGFRKKVIDKIDRSIIFDQALLAISKKIQRGKKIIDLKNIDSS